MSQKMTVVIAVPALSRRDAVCTDARLQRTAAEAAGWRAFLYAEILEPGTESESLSKAEFLALVREPSNILVYHMCVYWHSLEGLLKEVRCRVVVKYHNITPDSFFAPYDPIATHATREGLRQAREVIRSPRVDLLIATSPFTRQDILAMGPVAPCVEQAPFIAFTELGGCLEVSAVKSRLAGVNLVAVGRIVPNKGHRHLIGILSSYRELYGADVRLHLIGKVTANFQKYADELSEMLSELALTEAVSFVGSVDADELFTYYRLAQCVLVMSEHEGFCVPIIEAQYLGAPVIALDRTAVADTLGLDQLVSRDVDYDFFAAAAHAVSTNRDLRQRLVKAGHANVARFTEAELGGRFVAALGSLKGGE